MVIRESFRPLLRWRLAIFTVAVFVVAGRILAFGARLRDDRCPEPDRLFALLDVPVELVPPDVEAGDLRCLGILKFDEQRVAVRVVVEATLDVEPLLELIAGLRRINVVNEFVDPCFDGTVHLVFSRVGLLEGGRRMASRSHDVLKLAFLRTLQFRPRRAPDSAQKLATAVTEGRLSHQRSQL